MPDIGDDHHLDGTAHHWRMTTCFWPKTQWWPIYSKQCSLNRWELEIRAASSGYHLDEGSMDLNCPPNSRSAIIVSITSVAARSHHRIEQRRSKVKTEANFVHWYHIKDIKWTWRNKNSQRWDKTGEKYISFVYSNRINYKRKQGTYLYSKYNTQHACARVHGEHGFDHTRSKPLQLSITTN